jgi:uncharacterized protein (TIGR02265 family)
MLPLRERLIFTHTVEAMFVRGIGARMTPRLRARLAEARLDLDRLLPAYDYPTWERTLALAVEELFPPGDVRAAYHVLGEWMMDGYFTTFMGKALLHVVRVVGTRRTVERMRTSFRSGNNYTETRLDWLDATHARLWMNECRLAAYSTRGLIHRGLMVTRPRTLSVEIAAQDDDGSVFDISWT